MTTTDNSYDNDNDNDDDIGSGGNDNHNHDNHDDDNNKKQPDIQGVPGEMCQTSGECSLGQTIPI